MVHVLNRTHQRWSVRVDPYRAGLELLALAVTGALHLAWPLTELSRAFLVLPLVACWLGYFLLRWKVNPAVVREVGFRREGLWQTAAACAGLLVVGGVPMVLYGLSQGATIPWTFALTLVIYPVWGLVQQTLVQGLVTANVNKLASAPVTVVVSAALFGLVHWNEPILVGATFLLGLAIAPLYIRYRNLWALGVAHGWLGTLVYTFVLMRDPLAAYLLG